MEKSLNKDVPETANDVTSQVTPQQPLPGFPPGVVFSPDHYVRSGPLTGLAVQVKWLPENAGAVEVELVRNFVNVPEGISLPAGFTMLVQKEELYLRDPLADVAVQSLGVIKNEGAESPFRKRIIGGVAGGGASAGQSCYPSTPLVLDSGEALEKFKKYIEPISEDKSIGFMSLERDPSKKSTMSEGGPVESGKQVKFIPPDSEKPNLT